MNVSAVGVNIQTIQQLAEDKEAVGAWMPLCEYFPPTISLKSTVYDFISA